MRYSHQTSYIDSPCQEVSWYRIWGHPVKGQGHGDLLLQKLYIYYISVTYVSKTTIFHTHIAGGVVIPAIGTEDNFSGETKNYFISLSLHNLQRGEHIFFSMYYYIYFFNKYSVIKVINKENCNFNLSMTVSRLQSTRRTRYAAYLSLTRCELYAIVGCPTSRLQF